LVVGGLAVDGSRGRARRVALDRQSCAGWCGRRPELPAMFTVAPELPAPREHRAARGASRRHGIFDGRLTFARLDVRAS
jgi:hypothetical protein